MADLSQYRAVLFDLDGVLTPTADVHMNAWNLLFTDYFAERGVAPQYTEHDYFAYLDGKQRYEGVNSLLQSRGIALPWGSPADASDQETVCGLGNRKNDVFTQILRTEGVDPYQGSVALLDALRGTDVQIAVVSSSKNAEAVLTAAGLRARFEVIVDGAVAEREGLPSKPSPVMFQQAAVALGIDAVDAVVVEDAISGVQAGAAGGFGLVIGVDRGVGAAALRDAGATVIVKDLQELVAPFGAAQGRDGHEGENR